jgi:predicted acetyltransferase
MPPPHIELVPAVREQEPILANLLELYAYDFSEFLDIELNADGRFGYKRLPLYWTEPNRHPFLVRMDQRLAGLVLVKQGSEISGNDTVWDMAEFFVLRAYRRRGIGTEIAHQIWKRFPGLWEVRVIEQNRRALPFWEQAISAFIDAPACAVPVEHGDKCWNVFTFESK